MTKTITIHHPEYGWVEGLSKSPEDLLCWGEWTKEECGSTRIFSSEDGWREVSQARDVTENCKLLDDGKLRVVHNGCTYDYGLAGHKWRKVPAVVLPEGMTWEDLWKHITQGSPKVYWDYLKDAATTVIQVWEEEEE